MTRVSKMCYKEVTDEHGLEDGTYKNGTIVCDACYIYLMPYTRSGIGLNDELDNAIERVKVSFGT